MNTTIPTPPEIRAPQQFALKDRAVLVMVPESLLRAYGRRQLQLRFNTLVKRLCVIAKLP